MNESNDQTLILLSDLVQHTLQQLPSVREIERGSEQEKRLNEEINKLFADRGKVMQVLDSLFPEGIPISLLFFERLNDLHMRLGWGELSHRFTGLLLSVAVSSLPEESSELLLNELPAIKDHRFFQALESLTVLFDEREFRPAFASVWFPAIVRRIGNDLASAGFWKALAIYCEKHPENSLEISQRFLVAAPDEPEIAVGAYILGTVRTMEINEASSVSFSKIEGEFLSGQTANARLTYHRSWIQTARRGYLSHADLESLIYRMNLESGDHREQLFWILCRILLIPSLPRACF